ncbi:putative nucleotidyltransferase substrate binding domain-containing protein [Altererythrobacter arenosus]|uniref:Nucleotidyltransferase substrate binding domain-containing protein n=1 Tax=Altererythrobacter arenosus TaxID=3032592 RepID=A0ABY8G1Z4_9SPHN|nr:putative nucleotidyltransferase substrate binding domain-containing protein [Altererythrobacter sp. CAU 1644]WFL78979.1 putative nucleotidyltransferase substrate binding domain-containing protein [Altererythrobacter sp. CAU 1644]
MDTSLLHEIDGFLVDVPAFAALDIATRQTVSKQIEISYFRRGTPITQAGDDNQFLSIIRSGSVELRLGGTELHARLGERDCFGYPSLIRRGPAQNEATANEDCLLYRLPAERFHRLWEDHPAFRHFFDLDEAGRLRRAVGSLRAENAGSAPEESFGTHIPLGKIVSPRVLVSCDPGLTIGDAARMMADQDVSVLPVLEQDALVGILTDKDLRRRVLAVQLDLTVPVAQVMTPDPITAGESQTVLDALVAMTTHNIRHLPVVDASNDLVGIVSSSDVLSQLGSNSFHLAREVQTARDLPSLVDASAHLPRAVAGLVEAGVDADPVARYVSSIGELFHRRILALAEQELGPPPVPYALVCFGSLARSEVSLGSDQDNGFVFAETYSREKHDGYFAELGRRLADGLDSTGYRYCPGDIMASNPEYRATVGEWIERFAGWIEDPDPQAILESGIFFDIRPVTGEARLVEQLRTETYQRAAKNRIFTSFVARAAASSAVPLGFFRNFLLEKDAVEGKVLDLKAQAINPVIDLARTHAIANGIEATNTVERLRAASDAGALDKEAARDLAACFEFVRDVRFRHQAAQIRRGECPSNKLDPAELSRFDREHLRDAFKLIRAELDRLRTAYAGGLT